MSAQRRVPTGALTAIVLLLGAVIGLQAARERLEPRSLPRGETGNLLYVQSPKALTRVALSYRSLLADVYWMRALQHYGRTKQGDPVEKRYDMLFPLLDLTTSLDPMFSIAYRFGSIFLVEKPPAGPDRPDLAVALLKKGLASQPDRWEFAQDIGFVYYRSHDYTAAADWFKRASAIPGAPDWMAPLEAVTRTRGGDRRTARLLWSELVKGAGAEQEWLRTQGMQRLRQLDAIDQIEQLQQVVARYAERTGHMPQRWNELVSAGLLRGIPIDSDGHPFQLEAATGLVTLDPASALNPLPVGEDRFY